MGLSLNPSSWTPSNLAETLAEKLTGSEAIGDIAGLGAAYLTGDVRGLVGQGVDLFDNVGRGFMKFAEGVWNTAKDTVKEFSNPGAVRQPDVFQAPTQGYAFGEASGPTDTGIFGSMFGGDSVGEFGDVNIAMEQEMDRIMNNPNLSLETKIMLILLKLQRKKREEVEKEFKHAYALNKKASGMGRDDPESGKAKAESQEALALLQKNQQELNEMTQLTSGLSKMFHDMKMSTIQAIR